MTNLADIPQRYANPPDEIISTLPKGGTSLDFVGHADLTLQLIEVDPGWWWEPLAIDPETGGPKITTRGQHLVMWGRLHLLGTEIIEVGTCEAKKQEADKELVGDFLRRAAMRRGFATKLWSKTDREAGLNGNGHTEPAWDEARWKALGDDLKSLVAAKRDAVLGTLVDSGLFRSEGGKRYPNTPFTKEQLDAIGRAIADAVTVAHSEHAIEVMADALDCDDPVNAPPEGVEITDAMWNLAEVENCDEIDWKTTAKAFDMKQRDLLDQAQGIAKEVAPGLSPDRLDDIRGAVATELRRFLLSSGKPF